MVWYGIVAPGKPNELVEASGLMGLEVLWSRNHSNQSPTQRGCGLLLSGLLLDLFPDLLGGFLRSATHLGWQLHLRVPWEVPIESD